MTAKAYRQFIFVSVRWRHLAHDFISQLLPNMKVFKTALELDHHDNAKELSKETKQKLAGFSDVSTEVFVLFMESSLVESIINHVSENKNCHL